MKRENTILIGSTVIGGIIGFVLASISIIPITTVLSIPLGALIGMVLGQTINSTYHGKEDIKFLATPRSRILLSAILSVVIIVGAIGLYISWMEREGIQGEARHQYISSLLPGTVIFFLMLLGLIGVAFSRKYSKAFLLLYIAAFLSWLLI